MPQDSVVIKKTGVLPNYMNILEIVFPIISLFVLGVILTQLGLFNLDDANILIRLAFYVSLPALILKGIPVVEISAEFLFLPLIAMITILIMFLTSTFVSSFLNFERKTQGVFIIGTMILNLGFNVPFVIAAYGDEGFARAAFLDIGNILLVLSLTYYIAQKHGSELEPPSFFNKKLITSPPLIALILALILNFFEVTLDPLLINLFDLLGALLTPLLMISIGIYFNPRFQNLLPAISVVCIRMGLGLVLGFFAVLILNLDDLSNKIVIISTAAPVGFNTLTFASLEDLDREFAANVLSISIPVGICLITFLLVVLG
ncbi:MAG: AEC family transporter [Candidatus Heimdallarchaeota archaeon]|nr:MAG: AEC family transporter [Candidatus Heimdallarchaeota archaeon]